MIQPALPEHPPGPKGAYPANLGTTCSLHQTLGPVYWIPAQCFITNKQTTTHDNNATRIVKFAKGPLLSIEFIAGRGLQCCRLRIPPREAKIELRGGGRMEKRELASLDIWHARHVMVVVILNEIHEQPITIYSQIANLAWKIAVHMDMVKMEIT